MKKLRELVVGDFFPVYIHGQKQMLRVEEITNSYIIIGGHKLIKHSGVYIYEY